MDFSEKIQQIKNNATKHLDQLQTEEATKNALVMPFINALGYDVFNPSEVVPEYTADVGTKKGEKVDYALKKEDKIIILIECKKVDTNLDEKNASQLFRYFSVSESRFGILTNGVEYRFYSDLDEPNKMDAKPFFVFNLSDFDDHHIDELKKFTKSVFDLDGILNTANELKYIRAIKRFLSDQTANPSELFVKFLASQVYTGRITQQLLDFFTNIVQAAFNQFIHDRVNNRLKSALDVEHELPPVQIEPIPENAAPENDRGIVTTDEEIEGFNIVKAIVREKVDVRRVIMRDTKSYCGILLDDNNRKPICRLHFNYSQKYIGLFTNKNEERIPIDSPDDIFSYSAKLHETVSEYLAE